VPSDRYPSTMNVTSSALALFALLPPGALAQDPAPLEPAGMPLSLQDVVGLALDNNIGLRIDANAEEVQYYTHLGSWGSFDPLLSITGSYTDSQQPATTSLAGASVVESDTLGLNAQLQVPFRSGGRFDMGYDHSNTATNSTFSIDDTITNSSISLSYTQPLLRGAWSGYNTVEQQKAELRWRQAQARHRELRINLIRDVSQSYWDLVATREALAVQTETVALGEKQLAQNERRLEVGVGTEVEVLQAETNVATQMEVLLRSQTSVRAADDALKALIFARAEGDDWQAWFDWWDEPILPTTPLPEADLEALSMLDWASSLGTALSKRPELEQRRLDIEISELDLLKADSEEGPGLDATLGLSSTGADGQSSEAVQTAAGFDFPTASASLTYSAPLWNRAAENALAAARLGLRSSRLVYEQSETGILTEVRAAVRDSLYQAEAVKAAGTSYDLAQRQLDAEEARFEQGLSTNFQVLEYQQQLSQAKANLVAARVAYAKARTALARAEGRLEDTL